MTLSTRLAGKTILVVGGTSGLGLSGARACVAAGANVVVVGRDPAKGEAAVAEAPERMRSMSGDACLPQTIEQAMRLATESFGSLDGLYHVAGGSGRSRGDGPLDAITDEGWDYTLRENLDSVFISNRAVLRQWRETGRGGSILNMSSVLGFAPSSRFFASHAYAAAKAAIVGLTRAAASYYAPFQIRVNALAPGLVETPMAQRAVADQDIMRFVATKQPLDGGRIGQPADVDDAVVFFLSDESRFVTGQVLGIDGGWCLSDGQW